ncbi:MAG: efflux RND transporter periplasmic adaptor subunit [Gemmatimonadales bacterium]|nr:efflux RND transporter periplasmic adaptor subunit [Gemmatimonadota bacterium]MCB9504560.1 efflux RND transporter periplasmic adaptor subunit [Gemmatimonadales bacterium]MCA9768089.1 efflux RND transporter periplasmic adaptor subunit [Gemmatimonadota bacterium]MCB9518133.1 efflux RND transporter periplasmic adaptor subunit [Gemmatimonadales bacterium]HPF60720.1 efflux RND transporter periplasmic adaptor subunit [Gemmatimonadales bacterium]
MIRLRVLPVLLFLAACGGGGDAAAPGQGGGPPPATPVEVAVAFRDTVVDAITATGEVEPLQQVELTPDVDGRVTELLFREGSRVAQGAPLLKVDDAELRAQVARATADRDLANQALERTRVLLADRAAAPADLERAEATARAAEAALELLAVRLERTTVRAPFAGLIGARRVSLGDYVTPQTPLLTLQTVSPQRIAFQVPERYATSLARGQEVTFRVAALPGRTFTARVDFVDPVVTLPARAITVKAVAPNADGALQAGMFVEARLATETRAAATIVPEEAISPSAGASFVWVAIDGKATRREVELGVRTPGFVEVVRGVDPGEQVVVAGLERLYEGAALSPTVVERRPQGAGEG